jgi:PncC family amidohydrolase
MLETKILKLSQNIGKICRKAGLTISTAESCTGGLLSSYLTDIAGSSDYFSAGIVVYSNEAKIKQLGVSKQILEEFGAVSSQTAVEMAEKLKNMTNTDIAVSITGIAGPTGGSKEKPVGTVISAIKVKNEIFIYTLHSKGNRKDIKNKTCYKVLFLLRSLVKTLDLL